MTSFLWTPRLHRALDSPNHNSLREERIGVMIHFDASSTDEGAVAWFEHPDCRVSYQVLVLDDGSFVRIVDDDRRAWHAGRCRPSDPRLDYQDANSAFLGIAAATNAKVGSTEAQRLTIAHFCVRWFVRYDWPVSELWRIVGHRTEADPRGRKSDPEGPNLKRPILSVADIRELVRAA